MEAPLFVVSPPLQLPAELPAPPDSVAHLLHQVLEVQREQLSVMKAQAAAHDGAARWRAFLDRWNRDFPDIGGECKKVVPIIERLYLGYVQELLEKLRDEDNLDDEFLLGEFLDRYGPRLTQLGGLLNQIGPLAEAARTPPVDRPTSG